MYVRKSEKKDIAKIQEIYDLSRKFMHENGNPNQWITHPTLDEIESDIEKGIGYVVIENSEVCGAFALILGEDPTYLNIDGAWLNNEPYAVIHRLGSNFKYKGILEAAIKTALSKASNIRVDTHEDNGPMNHLLPLLGFKRCGEIYIKDDISDHSKRIAYQLETCMHKELCGGCSYQGIPYMYQLKHKNYEVLDLLNKRGIKPEKMDDIQGCTDIFYYRNKMEYTFGNIEKDAPLGLGMHKKKNFMSIVTVDRCMLVHPDFNKILKATLSFCEDKGYTFYHKKNHEGLLRNLVLRRGVRTKEILVNIVTTSDEFDEEGYKGYILSLELENSICGILHTIDDNIADTVNCEELRVLYGRDYYLEKICNLTFKVSAFSFFQTNINAVERLYLDAISLLSDVDNKIVFDLYSGTGTISQILSSHAKEVYGIEIVQDAVNSAIENTKLNNLNNCHFICGDCFKELEKIDVIPDVLVVDPPRVGMDLNAIEKICSYGCKEILYISCNPKTLIENLVLFEHLGYKINYLKPYDNFPNTKHVETVVLMSRDKE